MISQLFILSPRGDVIIKKEYRHDVPKTSPETFFRAVRFWKDGERAPAVFAEDGVHYLHVKANGLFLATTTRKNVSPSHVLELLHRVAKVIKDYCGVMNEDALRKNSVLAYELLDEMIDRGYAQSTSTEALKRHVFNEPSTPASSATTAAGAAAARASAAVKRASTPYGVFKGVVKAGIEYGKEAAAAKAAPTHTPGGTARRDATQRSVLATARDKARGGSRNEIFVDVVEKISVCFAASGATLTSEVDGCVQIRNFLHGSPEIKLALPEDLAIGGRDFATAVGGDYGFGSGGASGMATLLDDCNFHESADLSNFDVDRTIALTPPEGEFSLMNYRASCDFDPPFKVRVTVDETTPYKITAVITIKATYPSKCACTGMVVKFPTPQRAINANPTLEPGATPGTQHAAFSSQDKAVTWQFKKFTGGAEHTLRVNVSIPEERLPNARKELGPVSMHFTIPMFNVSRVGVRYLQIGGGSSGGGAGAGAQGKGKGPHRWVRYVTKSSSYVCRV